MDDNFIGFNGNLPTENSDSLIEKNSNVYSNDSEQNKSYSSNQDTLEKTESKNIDNYQSLIEQKALAIIDNIEANKFYRIMNEEIENIKKCAGHKNHDETKIAIIKYIALNLTQKLNQGQFIKLVKVQDFSTTYLALLVSELVGALYCKDSSYIEPREFTDENKKAYEYLEDVINYCTFSKLGTRDIITEIDNLRDMLKENNYTEQGERLEKFKTDRKSVV